MYKAGNYSNNTTSSNTKTSSDFGGDWTQGNPNFSTNNSTKVQAKQMAQQQIDKSKFKPKPNV